MTSVLCFCVVTTFYTLVDMKSIFIGCCTCYYNLPFCVYAGYLHLLEDWKDRYAPKPEDADWHPLFVEALQKYSYTEYLLDTLLTGTEAEKVAVVAGTRKEVAALERRVSGFKARDQQNDRKRGDGSRELAG